MFSSKFDSLRKSIVSSKDLVSRGKVILLSDEISERTNCYAYAIGLLGFLCDPGFTFGKKFLDRENLISNICKDLKNLKLKFRILKLNETILIKEDEYLIKVFCCDEPNEISKRGDFHFIRKDFKTKKWFHKLGWSNQPEFIEGAEATEIILCESSTGKKYSYTPVCYFAIKSKCNKKN